MLDLTDPGGPSEPLYTPDFYRACAARLKPAGRDDAAHREPGRASRAHPRDARQPARGVRRRHAVPDIGAALRRHVDDGVLRRRRSIRRACRPREIDRRIAQRGIADLQYYNGDMHRAALALPNFVRDLVA